MSTIIDNIERGQVRTDRPGFEAGDRVRVHFQVIEGSRRRTQVFEGVVLRRQGSGARETFTVRKQSFGVGVERTFPLHSPKIEKLEVAARGDVRRAKLYYLRDRVGKRARVTERRWGAEDEPGPAAAGAGAASVTAHDAATDEAVETADEITDEQVPEAADEETTESGAEEAADVEAGAEEQQPEPGAEEQQPESEADNAAGAEGDSGEAEDEGAEKSGKADESDD